MGLFSLFDSEQPHLVQQAVNDVAEMLVTSREMFEASTAFLLDNEELTLNLGAQDEFINDNEQSVRRAVLEHLAFDPQKDMVFCLVLLSIVHEGERAGDLCKSLARVARLAHEPRIGDHVAQLRTLRDKILVLFTSTHEAFVDGSTEKAKEIMEGSNGNKQFVKDFLKELATNTSISANEGIVYALSARMLGRVNSHLSNIASSVVLPFDQMRRSPTWE